MPAIESLQSIRDPVQVVRDYLAAMERRDLAAAGTMLAPGFRMTVPGGRRLDTLEHPVEFAKTRYRSARKTCERFDVAPDAALGAAPAGEASVVYCFGTLNGKLLSGEQNSGIRFIDTDSLSPAAGWSIRRSGTTWPRSWAQSSGREHDLAARAAARATRCRANATGARAPRAEDR